MVVSWLLIFGIPSPAYNRLPFRIIGLPRGKFSAPLGAKGMTFMDLDCDYCLNCSPEPYTDSA
jgi:hypothetical protein